MKYDFLHKAFYIIILFLFFSCKSTKLNETNNISLNNDFTKNWHLLDLTVTKMPGINLEQTLKDFKKPKHEIIVATIDNLIDKNHP